MTPEILNNSIIVTAHPDDEVLWFSSTLANVGEILFCYMEVKSNPQWSLGRRKSLSEYPLENISSLALDESEVFSDSNFLKPEITYYGMKINSGVSEKKYIHNYSKLLEKLHNKLKGYENVFTHNPWGEYGNEEHIQVYRAVKALQNELHYNLWFSSYCSNKSFNLMLQYPACYNAEYRTFQTNKVLAHTIRDLYQKNGCWTWYDDWNWYNEESFIKDRSLQDVVEKYGRSFPLNMIQVEIEEKPKKETYIFGLKIPNPF